MLEEILVGEQFYTAIRSNDEHIVWKAAINESIRTLKSVGSYNDEGENISINNVSIKLIGSDENPGGTNEFIFDANKFKNNKIFINNGPSGVIDGSLNKIEVSNGNGTKQSRNEIFINNAKDVQNAINNIKFENGTGGQRSINNNRYVINNGYGGTSGTVSQYDVYNGDAHASEKLYTKIDWNEAEKKDEVYACITEYSVVERISNIGVVETKNVGSFQTINVGDTQKINIGVTQNLIVGTIQTVDIGQTQNTIIGKEQTIDIGKTQDIKIGTSKTIDVPTYTFNTTDMTMNNKSSTTTNTEKYTLNCKEDKIIAVTSYSLTAGKIDEKAVANHSITAGGAVSILAVGAGTFNAGGTVSVGSANPKGATNITGLFNATGYLTGHSTWAATAGSALPHGSSSPNNPKEGPGGTSASAPPAPVLSPPPALKTPGTPAEFPGVETPQTPYLFTKILQLYVEYLIKEFSYLRNIFR